MQSLSGALLLENTVSSHAKNFIFGGGLRETHEMLDFCGEHGIAADIEVIPIQKINEAYERLLKGALRLMQF